MLTKNVQTLFKAEEIFWWGFSGGGPVTGRYEHYFDDQTLLAVSFDPDVLVFDF